MKLTKEQIEIYDKNGMIFIPDCFSNKEVENMQAALSVLMEKDTPGRVFEKDKKTIRALHGCNMNSTLFQRLTLHPRLLEPVKQLLNGDVYTYQFKINLKAPFNGDWWPWHQDFIFWEKEDGMPSPNAINVAIFLNEVNEFNGPMYFIPGSHKQSYTHIQENSTTKWIDNFIADLKYTLDKATIAKLVEKEGIIAPKGCSGSVLFFHCNLVHGSLPNISPYERALAIITYNNLNNIPVFKGEPRPEFLVSQDYTSLQSLTDEVLL